MRPARQLFLISIAHILPALAGQSDVKLDNDLLENEKSSTVGHSKPVPLFHHVHRWSHEYNHSRLPTIPVTFRSKRKTDFPCHNFSSFEKSQFSLLGCWQTWIFEKWFSNSFRISDDTFIFFLRKHFDKFEIFVNHQPSWLTPLIFRVRGATDYSKGNGVPQVACLFTTILCNSFTGTVVQGPSQHLLRFDG